MAIAIPLIMAYAGTTAAISTAIGLTALVGAGVGAAVVGIGVGLATQKFGINDRINKAASKVFGEDLVMVGNVVGAAMLMNGAAGGAASGATDGAMSGLDGAKSFTEMASGAFDAGTQAGEGILSNASMGAAMTQAPTAAMDLSSLSGVSAGVSAPSFQFQPTDFAAQLAEQNGVLAKAGGVWNGLGEKMQVAVVQGGATMLDGYMRSRDQQKMGEQAQQRQDLRTRGSGFFDKYSYGAGG